MAIGGLCKQIYRKDMEIMGNELTKRPKLEEIEIIADDLNSILDMSLKSVKLGRIPKFPDTEQGLEDFKSATVGYLEYVRATNNNTENEHNLIPDIESWCTFLGLSRQTLLTYEKTRDDDWKDYIQLVKTAIVAMKKQLGFRQKIPSLVLIFDLCNNHGYLNTGEYKFKEPTDDAKNKSLSAAELPQLGQAGIHKSPI